MEASVVTAPVCNRLVFHGPVSGLLAGLPAALTRVAAEASQGEKGRRETGDFHQAGRTYCSPAAVSWLEELPWQLHIALLILLSMHTRGKRTSAPQYSADRGLRECLLLWLLSQNGKFRAEVEWRKVFKPHPPTAL